MTPSGPQNTRDFLPPTQDVKYVPMSEGDFNRARNRKILIWVGSILAGALILTLTLWKSSTPATAQKAYDDAVKLYSAGKYPEAVTLLTQAIGEKSNLIEAYQLRGNAYRFMNDPENAVADFNKVIQAHPNDPDNYRFRGQCYHDLGKFDDAIKDYNKLLELKPSAVAYNGRGICYRDLGQVGRAIEDFSKAVQLDPNIDNVMQRGMAYASINEHKKAIEDYNRVIDMRPDVPYPYRARAFAKDAIGDRSGATMDREKARGIEFPVRKLADSSK
jgi:tetratricopeptide (TPR) repeat protein